MEAKTKKYLLWGLGAVAVGTGGYFLFKYLQDKKNEQSADDFKEQVNEGSVDVPHTNSSSSLPSPKPFHKPVVYNQFPLKYGSKGTLVRDIQNALNKKYGAKIDVDGDWKGQTENALIAKGLPTTIDNQVYAKIITGTYGKDNSKPSSGENKKPDKNQKPSNSTSSAAIAKLLHTAIEKDDVFSAVNALKKIKDKAKYKTVNEEFKKTKYWTFMDGYVSRTVVNAMLDQFTSAEYKKKINAELYRIGLKYDGTKWSLSGLLAGTQRLISVQPTVVWDYKGRRLSVPRSTILGTFIRAKNGITEFETLDGRILYTNTITIRYAA
jgi:hypothetical protein